MLKLPNVNRSGASAGGCQPIYARPVLIGEQKGHFALLLTWLIHALIFLGLGASIIAINEAHPKAVNTDGVLITNKTTIYYVAHALQIACLLLGGSLSWLLLQQRFRNVLLIPILAFLSAAAVMTLRGYTGDEFLSSKIAGWTGILPCLLSVLIFYGAREQNFKVIDRMIRFSAFALTGVLVLASLRHPFHTRADALANLQEYLIALYTPAVFLIFQPGERWTWVHKLLNSIPMVAYAAGSILIQTRLNLLMLVPTLGMYLFLQWRRKKAASAVVIVTLAVVTVLILGSVLLASPYGESLAWSLAGLQHRMDSDTRTGQIMCFLADMTLTDIVIGRGAQASWIWAGKAWFGGIDVGYFEFILFGGLPLLISYFVLHIIPGIEALKHPVNSRQLAAAAAVVLWGLRLLSTGYMDFNPGYYSLLFCVGACLQRQGAYRVRAPQWRLSRTTSGSAPM